MSDTEKPWDELDDAAFRERDAAFRESLRRSTPVGPNEYATLDAATLNEEQLGALTRVLQGRGNSFDRSICARGLAEQRSLMGEK